MSSTLTCTSWSTCSTRTATEPSEGVCRNAFVRRLSSTRSIFSGAKRAVPSSVDARGELDASPSRIGLDAAQARLDDRLESAARELEGERTRVDACQLEKVVDERARAPAPAPERGKARRGSTRPSSSASSIACMLASGVRRSWLAQATSSRRASKSRSRLAAISLNETARSRDLRRAAARAPAPPGRRAASARRGVADAVDRVRDRTGEHERRDDRDGRGRRRDGEELHVVAHVEHHPAGQEHRGERQADREEREPGELQPDAREQRAARRRRPTPTTSVATRDDEREAITARAGSRRPRPSAGGAGADGVVLDLLAQPAHVDGDGARVERGLVAPDPAHQLVAPEDPARMARQGTRAGRTPSR